ncbi:MAG: T9SS type A sorting domain-containing protein [Weeksellaceae bacterium]|nr:T9SS type A sorting domain-containing protein [Weeksellaceae bacterium]
MTPGTHTAPAITGTYVTSCDQSNGDKAAPTGIWYSYTPTSNGQLVVSSNISTNVAPLSDDTRVSIYSGTCAALTCVGGNDDISATNYLSTLTVTVLAGTTYYIQWDDRWSAAGFTWSLAFTPVSCLPVNGSTLNVTNETFTSATLSWTAVSGAASYDIEYGAPGFVQGTGTVINTATTSATISGLTAGTGYQYYVRNNCGSSQSTWVGPYQFFTATDPTPSYAYGFDNAAGYPANGWSGSWSTNATAGNPQAGTQMVFSNNSTTLATNRWLYSAPLYLAANKIYTVTFYLRLFGATPPPQSIKLTYGTDNTEAAQTTTVWTSSTVAGTTWTQYSATFTPPSNGTYFLAFNHFSGVQASAVSLALDTFTITGALGVNDIVSDNSTISVYPNPTSDILNIKSKDKVNAVSLTDMSGRRIEAGLINNTVDVRALQSGTYIINIETANGKTSQKFIKK